MVFLSILTLIVAKALPFLNTNISSIQYTRITSIVFIFTGALSFNIFNIESIGTSAGIGIYSGLFQVTNIGQLLEIFLFIIGGLILISMPLILVRNNNYNNCNNNNNNNNNIKSYYITDSYSRDYSLIVLFSSLGSSLLISSFDLISVYLSIELQSFGLYVLATLYRNSESSTSAGLKYFLLGGLSSCIILLGVGLIYSYSGTTNFESLYILNTINSSHDNLQYVSFGISFGLILIFIGFLFKIAAAPLHNWSPDVYDGVPTIVTTWLTIIPKISILVLLLELEVQLGIIGGYKTVKILEMGNNFINNGLINIKTLLIISALLSLIVGSLLGLSQIRIKRLLAYSTISHIGFILLALSINSEQSIDSFIFYIIQYTIVNLNIFISILGLTYILNNNNFNNINLGINNANFIIKDINYISQLKGVFFSNPLISLSLCISLFSMAGIPPLIGFFSKQFVLYSAINNGYYFIAIIAIIVSVISCSYYLKIVKVIIEEEEETTNNTQYEQLNIVEGDINKLNNNYYTTFNISNFHSYLISTLSLIILLFFIQPSIILNSTQLLSLSLFYI